MCVEYILEQRASVAAHRMRPQTEQSAHRPNEPCLIQTWRKEKSAERLKKLAEALAAAAERVVRAEQIATRSHARRLFLVDRSKMLSSFLSFRVVGDRAEDEGEAGLVNWLIWIDWHSVHVAPILHALSDLCLFFSREFACVQACDGGVCVV